MQTLLDQSLKKQRLAETIKQRGQLATLNRVLELREKQLVK